RKIEVPKQRVAANPEKVLKLTGARGNNLQLVNLTLPVGQFNCINGVSGSGKTTLINHNLFPLAHTALNQSLINKLPCRPQNAIVNLGGRRIIKKTGGGGG
ncbi:hypothetical protein, partial [Enterobacter sichuanensis]